MNALDRVVSCLRKDERLVLVTRLGEDMAAMAILAARERKLAKERRAEKKAAMAEAAAAAKADAEEEAGSAATAAEAARAAAKKAEAEFERKRKITIPVVGDLGTNLIRLALEFTKNLRKTDPVRILPFDSLSRCAVLSCLVLSPLVHIYIYIPQAPSAPSPFRPLLVSPSTISFCLHLIAFDRISLHLVPSRAIALLSSPLLSSPLLSCPC